ncbi:ATP-binding protein [Aurantimonas sp. E1-2-R+4]|uniref:hybrid sensor histidine kinase/response regulator n=1 Tax=Aurantimonas sp. E1-2-R+4 TaxID=3113714 RepID=UPI002F92801B
MPVVNLIESASVITLAVLCVNFIGDRLDRMFWLKSILLGIVFSLTGLISMLSPVSPAPGIFIDARNVVIALSAIIGGPVSVVFTVLTLSIFRVSEGGAGALTGVASITLVAVFATLGWLWIHFRKKGRLDFTIILAVATVAAAVPVFSVTFLLPISDPKIAVKILSYVVPTNLLGVIVFGILFLREQQRRWALAALLDSQAQMKAVANNAPGVLFQMALTSSNTPRLRYLSGGAKRVIGISAEEALAKPEMLTGMVPPKTMQRLSLLLAQSAESGAPWTIETEFTRPDGRMLWMRASAEPRRDQTGTLVWDGTLFDISEEKRNEQLRNDFISTVSHELRTPLTSIRGSLGLVAAGAAGEMSSKATKLIAIAHSNSERLVRLINDILDIEKIETGNMPFAPRPLQLRSLTEEAVEASRDYLSDRGVSIEIKDEAPGAVAVVDPDRFHQLIANLLSNAIKFSPQNGQIEVRLTRSTDYLRISVKDGGAGIPEAFRERIFGKFEQADASDTRAKGGTGLGLSIAKAIVERLGGQLSFDSEVGVGTIFHVDLPEARGAKTSGEEVVQVFSRVTGGKRILICEDDADVAAVIAHMIDELGIATDIAPDVATARAYLTKNHYMAMTLDIKLGGGSGIALYDELRSMHRCADLPVIVVSAIADETRKTLNGQAVGIVDWLAKPIDSDRLTSVIRDIAADDLRAGPKILHVEDDEGVLQVISASLGDGVDITGARTVAEARQKLGAAHFDLIILDLSLPDGTGASLLSDIPADTAIVIFSAYEIDDDLASRVHAAMTKTKTSEVSMARLIKSLTFKRSKQNNLIKQGAA